MKYPKIKIDGKPIKLNKKVFDWYKNQVKRSLTFDNEENDLGLTTKDIKLLSWNCAVMVYHTGEDFVDKPKFREGFTKE